MNVFHIYRKNNRMRDIKKEEKGSKERRRKEDGRKEKNM